MLKQLANLPREGRDTLFLLGVIAWVLLPQVPNLPVWCSALAASVLLWRGWLAWQARPLPGKWWLAGLLVVTTAATLYTHKTLLGRDAGVTLIVVLLALKTLELRARRDAFVVFFLGFFTMLTNFFFSQSLPVAAAMLVALLGLLTALVNAHMPVGKPPLLQAARTAGSMALLGAPVMLVLFLLFPRLAPLWGVPNDAMSGRSGLSSSMTVGNIASLALDDSIAMRVRFIDPVPAQSDLYFRGPVLSGFDGREWQVGRPSYYRPPTNPGLTVLGAPVRYEVTMEITNRPWLMVLDATAQSPTVPGFETRMTPQLQWLVDKPISDMLRYQVQSHTSFRYGPQRFVPALQDDLALPAGYNPRTLQWAAELRRDPANAGKSTPQLVALVMDHLRSGGYTYTLEPGVYGRDGTDEFWFDRKLGFCEHIASAFVVVMRAMDIPARVVTGYQGGERNTVDDYWVLRQSDAHAWAEVWVAGQGWLRVDPTSAVAPGRTGSFQRLQAPKGLIGSALGQVSPALSQQLRAVWDAMNNGWNQWVLNYSQSRQLNLLKNLGFESPSWEDLAYVLAGLLVAASLCGALWTLWERSRHDPWLRLLEKAQQRLNAAGVELAPASPPRQMVQRLRERFGAGGPQAAQTQPIVDWLLRLEAWRYAPAGAQSGAGGLATLQRDFKQLPWPQ